jgi:uncharacterized protein with HEPN domain
VDDGALGAKAASVTAADRMAEKLPGTVAVSWSDLLGMRNVIVSNLPVAK